jgi:DNA-binding NarL/FixJ family response regulator
MDRKLNKRQYEVLQFIRKGLRNKEIGPLLNLSERTVKGYVAQLLLIFDVSNRTELTGLTAPSRVPPDGGTVRLDRPNEHLIRI